jgi:hypothetical protein
MITLHFFNILLRTDGYTVHVYFVHYIPVFTASSLTVLVLKTALFPFWWFLLLGRLLNYLSILAPSFLSNDRWRDVLQWWLTPTVMILYTIWATSLIGLKAVLKVCVYIVRVFYFLYLAHECRCLSVTCNADTEEYTCSCTHSSHPRYMGINARALSLRPRESARGPAWTGLDQWNFLPPSDFEHRTFPTALITLCELFSQQLTMVFWTYTKITDGSYCS